MTIANSNSDIPRFAIRGNDARTRNGNFSTDHYRPEFTRYAAPYVGYLPAPLKKILNARFVAGAISQVIYSYSTPIAWKDGDVWVIPDVSYSRTTSCRHMPHVSRALPYARYIPWDAGMEEYLRVVEGLTVYTRPRNRNAYGTYRAPFSNAQLTKANDPRYLPGVSEHDDDMTDSEWFESYGTYSD